MKNSKCPWDDTVTCAYTEIDESVIVYECENCSHYHKTQKPPDPIHGTQMIGCLFGGLLLIAAILFIAAKFILHIRG